MKFSFDEAFCIFINTYKLFLDDLHVYKSKDLMTSSTYINCLKFAHFYKNILNVVPVETRVNYDPGEVKAGASVV